MTRRKLQKTMLATSIVIGMIIATAAIARLWGNPLMLALYEFIRDMSLLIATLAAAYLANIFQRRQNFLQSLREQWRDIVDTKSELISYCDTHEPTPEHFLEARGHLSRTIDNMRIVYTNVGETRDKIGYFPFEPLHDMRRAVDRMDRRHNDALGPQEHAAVRDAIWEAFNAMRERFLDEFDLEEPTAPILKVASRRTKQPGARRGHPGTASMSGTQRP